MNELGLLQEIFDLLKVMFFVLCVINGLMIAMLIKK